MWLSMTSVLMTRLNWDQIFAPKSVIDRGTLAAEMFGVGDFWLKIRGIIKICPILDIQEPLTDFHRNEAKHFFLKKRSKMADSKN